MLILAPSCPIWRQTYESWIINDNTELRGRRSILVWCICKKSLWWWIDHELDMRHFARSLFGTSWSKTFKRNDWNIFFFVKFNPHEDFIHRFLTEFFSDIVAGYWMVTESLFSSRFLYTWNAYYFIGFGFFCELMLFVRHRSDKEKVEDEEVCHSLGYQIQIQTHEAWKTFIANTSFQSQILAVDILAKTSVGHCSRRALP